MNILSKLKRPLAVFIAVLMVLTIFISQGSWSNNKAYAGEIIALADNEWFRSVSGGVSPFNVDTVWIHYRSDGALAYCRQKGINNPDGTVGNYAINNWEPGEDSVIAGLAANADSIAASYGISGDEKRALIQMAIWTVEAHYDSMNPSLSSVSSSNPNMMAALNALYNAAWSGYTPAVASISGLTSGAKLVGSVYGEYVRYGPFSVSGSTGASASADNAPAGSFFGNAAGAAINKDAISNGLEFWFYIPATSAATAVPGITIRAGYNTVTVTKYSGFWGYQDQIVLGDPGTGTMSVSGTVLGFGKAELWKHDDEVPASALSGAVFAIDQWSRASSDWSLANIPVTWNPSTRRYETGTLFETTDNDGRFRIRETAAPYAYLTGWFAEISVHEKYGAAFALDATNTPVKLKITVTKKDSVTTVAQGDATLAGAVYGLYMNEDREHPDGRVFSKDQKIAEGVTDAAGGIIFENLFPAMYYVKELHPSEGYLLNDAIYEIDGRADGVSEKIEKATDVIEVVKKQAFELIKGGDIPDETEMELLEAGFKIYLISDLKIVKDALPGKAISEWVHSDFVGYDFTSEPTAKTDGVTIGEIFTDALGFLRSPELPYGTYVVVETTVPKGREAIKPFIVKVTEDSRTPQDWRLMNDKQMEYYIRIIKKDADTGNTVLGKSAMYRIFDLESGEYITMKSTYPQLVWHGTEDNPFKTDDTGKLITPEKLTYGLYRLDEVVAPDGYVLAGYEEIATPGYDPDGTTTPNPKPPVIIEFDSSIPVRLDGTGDAVLEVVQENEQQRGKINIEKKGEQPDAVTYDENGNAVFRYEDEPLEGVIFEVIADGDILSQDGSGTVVYKDGEVVISITTDEDGHAWAEDLVIGDYILREVDAPAGYLFVDDEHFSITKIDQTQQFSFLTWDLTDVRKKLDIEIIKKEKDTGAVLAGAEFTLYAAEDIYFGDENGGFIEQLLALFSSTKVVIKEGEVIAKAVANANGIAYFSDLPPGKYYAKETKAPHGYLLNAEWRADFTLAYDESRTVERQVYTAECTNVPQKLIIEITKVDGQSRAKLAGAEFTLYSKDGVQVAKAVSGADGMARFENLKEGSYYVIETKAPNGYVLNKYFKKSFELKYDEHGEEVLIWKGTCANSKAPAAGTNPKMGDQFPVPLLILLLAFAGVSLTFILGRKKKVKSAK